MIYNPFRGFNSAENRDRNFHPIIFKFGTSIVEQILEIPYKFLRDWTIFDWDMLFLVSNYWLVKIKKKLKCSQWRHFLLFLIEIYRGSPFYRQKSFLKISSRKLESFRAYLLQSFQKDFEKITSKVFYLDFGWKKDKICWRCQIFCLFPKGEHISSHEKSFKVFKVTLITNGEH